MDKIRHAKVHNNKISQSHKLRIMNYELETINSRIPDLWRPKSAMAQKKHNTGRSHNHLTT